MPGRYKGGGGEQREEKQGDNPAFKVQVTERFSIKPKERIPVSQLLRYRTSPSPMHERPALTSANFEAARKTEIKQL
jgi:hypothetical protein